jgi:hypothetical protein
MMMPMPMIPRLMLRRTNILPLLHPLHQLMPATTLMYSSKPSDTAQCEVLDFHRQIGLAHKGLAKEINTVVHVHRRNLKGDVFDLQRICRCSCIQCCPVCISESILM